MTIRDRIRTTTTQTGTLTTISVGATPPTGFQKPSARFSVNDADIPVVVAHQTADEWQVCWCTYSSADTFTVNSVIYSSNSDNAVSFSSGTKDVFVVNSSASVGGLREVNTWTKNQIFQNTGLKLLDTGSDHTLTIKPNENLAADRTLNVVVGAADRTLTFADNATVGRTITGTANEITVTNGNGVSGNPTLSLPTALTFTGKTITGGTLTGITDLAVADGGTGASDAATARANLGLTYRDSSNIYPDPDMSVDAFYTASGGGALSTVGAVLELNSSANTGAGTRRLRIDSNAADRTVATEWFVVTPSTSYEFSVMASQQGTLDSTAVDVDLEEGSLNSGAVTALSPTISLVSNRVAADVGQSARVSAVFTTTSTARRARLLFKRRAGVGNNALFARPELRLAFLQAGTGAAPRSVQNKLRDYVSVFDFMTPAQVTSVIARDNLVDVTTPIQNAINSVSSGGVVYFPPGEYVVTSTLTANSHTIHLRGSGARSTVLRVNHTSGPAIQIKYFFSGVSDMTIQGSTTRRDAAAGTNYGVFFPTDTAISTSRFVNYVRGCIINNHSSHGVYATGQGWVVEDCRILDCGGHGVYIDNFDAEPTMVAGFCEIKNTQIAFCKGHGVCGGVNRMVFRVTLDNVDPFKCLTDSNVRLSTFVVHLDKAENVVIRNCGFGMWTGDSPNRVRAHSGIYINGKSAKLYGNRFIDFVAPAIKLGPAADGAYIEGCHLDGEVMASIDPVVEVDANATGVQVVQNETTWVGRAMTVAPMDSGNISIVRGIVQQGYRSRRGQLGINDDAVGTILTFSGSTRGILVLSGNSSTFGGAIIAFRTGDGSAYCTVIAGPATTVGATIGSAPTGTSGVDGELTIYARTDATYTLHINNRRGANGEFMPTLLSAFVGEYVSTT